MYVKKSTVLYFESAGGKSSKPVDDFIWSEGSIDVLGDWTVRSNNHNFRYRSLQISTVAPNTTVHIENTTFAYSSLSPNLFQLTDHTSILHLDRGRILVTPSWTRINGTLLTTGDVTLQTAGGISTLDLRQLDSIQVQGSVLEIGNVLI